MNHQHRIMQKEQNQQNQPLIGPISSISKISIISIINFKEAGWMESFNCKRLDFLKYTKQLSKIWKQVSTCLNIIRIIIRIICLRVSLHVSGPVASVVSHGRASLRTKTIQDHSASLKDFESGQLDNLVSCWTKVSDSDLLTGL